MEMALGVRDTATEEGLEKKKYEGPQGGSSKLGAGQLEEDESFRFG